MVVQKRATSVCVLHVYSEVIDSWVYRTLSRDLPEHAVNVTHCFLNEASKPLQEAMADNSREVVCLGAGGPGKFRLLFRLLSVIRQVDADVIVGFGQTSNLLLALLRNLRVVKGYIGTRGHADYHTRKWRLRGRLYDFVTYASPRTTIVHSATIEEWLQRKYPRISRRIVCIPHAVELQGVPVDPTRIEMIRSELAVRDNVQIVCAVSRPIEAKGLVDLVRAYRLLVEEDGLSATTLVLANWVGEPHSELQELLDDCGHLDIRRVPRVSDVQALLASASAFVHVPVGPFAEGFGQVYVEALSVGVQCIFTESGAIRDLPPQCRSLYTLVPYRNTRAIRNSLLAILNDRVPRAPESRVRNVCLEPFRERVMVVAYADLYHESIRQHLSP